MAEQIRRIHIIGGPGSGKTTVAFEIGRRLGVPVYELDLVGYEDGAGERRPLDSRLADVRDIAAEPGWVAEGVFLGWADELLRESDVILWLDVPWRVAAYRIIRRHLKESLAGTNRHPGVFRLFRFLRIARRYYSRSSLRPVELDNDGNNSRAATSGHLEPFAGKVIRCASADDLKKFMHGLPNR
jgi:adenylate kinase family enzyme